MPMRLSVGKRAGEACEGSIGRRRRLSSVGNNFANRSANLDPNDAYDRERSSSHLGRFRSISPVIRPALGGSRANYNNNSNNNNNRGISRSGSGSGSIQEEREGEAAAAAAGLRGSLWTGPVSTVQRTLSTASYTEFDLVNHLHTISNKDPETVVALGDVYRQRDELTVLTLFSLDPEVLDAGDQFAACEVYEVRQDGSVIPRYDGCIDRHNEGLEASATWSLIKDVNIHKVAVGRITILQQPSATSFAGIHLTLGRHFDMDELFAHLISKKLNKGKTTPYMLRAFEPEPIHQRTFFFVFKYYTVVDDGYEPSSWQCHGSVQTTTDEDALLQQLAAADKDEDEKDGSSDNGDNSGAIHISECSSILALSLEGDVVDQVSRRASKSNRVKMGSVFETFAPFHVLSIQCFPDGIVSDRVLAETPVHSGPQAFLECLAMEYRTAVQRLWKLNERISGLVIPPDEFMFDLKLRDQLLFEDADFTFSRRYFWAYNSLAMVNDSIRSMIDAYSDTFNPTFWMGQHPTLWPHPDPDSIEGANYLARLGVLRHDLEASLRELRALIKSNEQLRREIDNLREQLYSGSSVKENRTAIEQGENIKILTGVSMLFMPLSFVTSVFGMQAFDIAPTDWRFVVVMITICVPFFVLVFILQTTAGMSLWRRARLWFRGFLDTWQRRSQIRRDKRSQIQQAAMIRKQSCVPGVSSGGGGGGSGMMRGRRGSNMMHGLADSVGGRRSAQGGGVVGAVGGPPGRRESVWTLNNAKKGSMQSSAGGLGLPFGGTGGDDGGGDEKRGWWVRWPWDWRKGGSKARESHV